MAEFEAVDGLGHFRRPKGGRIHIPAIVEVDHLLQGLKHLLPGNVGHGVHVEKEVIVGRVAHVRDEGNVSLRQRPGQQQNRDGGAQHANPSSAHRPPGHPENRR